MASTGLVGHGLSSGLAISRSDHEGKLNLSSGHKNGSRPIERAELEEVLADPKVIEELEKDFEIDTDHDLPYLAGYSRDGTVRYVDRHLCADGHPVGTIEINGDMVDVLPFLVGDPEAKDPIKRGGHEGIEKAAEVFRNKKITYMPSYDFRHEVATGGEMREVVAAGIKRASYTKALAPFIKACEVERLEKVPHDLDMTPYLQAPVDKKLLDRMHAAMKHDGDKEKYTKEEVDYSDGNKAENCGLCEHFEVERQNGCELVDGYIEAKKWCDKFEREGDDKDEDEEADE